MSDRNKADENPDDEYLLDALRDLDPTPIEELIDKSNMDDGSKKRFHESLRAHDSNIAREQSVKIAVGEALRELDRLSERLDEISALTVWDSSRPLSDAIPSVEAIRVILKQIRGHDNGCVDSDSRIRYRLVCDVDGGALPLLGQMSDGADGLVYLKNVLDACKSANIEGNPRIQYAYVTGWRDLN